MEHVKKHFRHLIDFPPSVHIRFGQQKLSLHHFSVVVRIKSPSNLLFFAACLDISCYIP